jgi:hypothetical protein
MSKNFFQTYDYNEAYKLYLDLFFKSHAITYNQAAEKYTDKELKSLARSRFIRIFEDQISFCPNGLNYKKPTEVTEDKPFKHLFTTNILLLKKFLIAINQDIVNTPNINLAVRKDGVFSKEWFKDLKIMNPEITGDSGTNKDYIIMDIKAVCSDEKKIFDIEMQRQDVPIERWQYYTSSEYYGILRDSKKEYDLLKGKQVFCIVICGYGNPNGTNYLEYTSNYDYVLRDRSLLKAQGYVRIYLPNFKKQSHQLQSPLDFFLYFLKKPLHRVNVKNVPVSVQKLYYEYFKMNLNTTDNQHFYEVDTFNKLKTQYDLGRKHGMEDSESTLQNYKDEWEKWKREMEDSFKKEKTTMEEIIQRQKMLIEKSIFNNSDKLNNEKMKIFPQKFHLCLSKETKLAIDNSLIKIVLKLYFNEGEYQLGVYDGGANDVYIIEYMTFQKNACQDFLLKTMLSLGIDMWEAKEQDLHRIYTLIN